MSSVTFMTWNTSKVDCDFIVRGLTDNNLLKVDAGLDAVGIGVATTVASSAILDVKSTTKGILFPRMTTVQRDAIASPVAGLVIYNTTTNVLDFYNGTVWGPV